MDSLPARTRAFARRAAIVTGAYVPIEAVRLRLSPGRAGAYRRVEGLYRHFVTTGDLCFDVGAYVGARSHVLLGLGARVVAVEPLSECARLLRRRFHHNPRFAVVQKAVASSEGEQPLYVSDVRSVSTISAHYVEASISSRRFGETRWPGVRTVPVTTLDKLIDEFGEPVFCKIDVEGAELEVLSGLSHPVPAISFEFSPHVFEVMEKCLSHLRTLGSYRYNYSHGEDMTFDHDAWMNATELIDSLARYRGTLEWGDIYAALEPREAGFR